jgi:uncharacterized protein with FMN-binding domain
MNEAMEVRAAQVKQLRDGLQEAVDASSRGKFKVEVIEKRGKVARIEVRRYNQGTEGDGKGQ